METKSRKQLVLTGAARFNAKPKTGLAFLEEHGLIYADLGPETTKAQSLARFLKGCGRIDKRLLGDFISKPDNVDVLHAFISLFDFKGVCACAVCYPHLARVGLTLECRNILQMLCGRCSSHSGCLEKHSRLRGSRRRLRLYISLRSQVS